MTAVELERVRLGGRNFVRLGDVVRVKPSRPGKRDGFLARVRRILEQLDGDVVLEVAGIDSHRARDAVRTLPLERLERVSQTRVAELLTR